MAVAKKWAVGWWCALAVAGMMSTPAAAAPEDDTLAKLAQLRNLPATSAAADVQQGRKELDNAWRWLGNNKAAALPVLRRELAAELKKAQPNQYLLLELGHFLRVQGTAADRALSLQALLALDPVGIVPQTQQDQLFRFVHASAADRDPRLFKLMDQVFLRGHVTVFLPQHGYTVDETSVCIYLYGQYGALAERHLAGLLHDPQAVHRALELLMWVGSPDSVPAVAALLNTADADTFARATTFLLRAGGPAGREALGNFDARGLQGKAREFYLQTRQQLASMNFDTLVHQLEEAPGGDGNQPPRRLDAAAAQAALAALEQNYGSYADVQPAEIATSALPAAQLIDGLIRVRERSLLRISGEALTDIDTTNTLINTLRFRGD
ncbi:hypothetical protein IP91_01593 [Pseudoduganella lurida]|uniref:Chemotaxis protein n=1 Tax=Pseudoduganella lurida TaxID=1036180 RepID=A0A562RGD6_9BURK|nr:hypothetical protein [Pseudoduganella lurida]TWI67480.1 hypothetical protein IP91_01593 [Pseudoduganella lurida]